METTGRTGKPYQLADDATEALTALIEAAQRTLHEPLDGNERLIADIYTGRDPLGGASGLMSG